MKTPPPSWKPILAIVAIVALLVALAALQYRWIGEVSRLERDRLHDALLEATRRFADDLDREVSRLALTFAVPGPDALGDAWRRWQEEAATPEMLAQVLVWSPTQRTLEAWDPESGALRPASWPGGLEGRVADLRGRQPPDRLVPGGPFPPAAVVAWPPTVIVPLGSRASVRPFAARRRDPPGARAARDDDGARLVLRLDEATLSRKLLPRLAEAHLSAVASVAVDLAVLAPGAGAGGAFTIFSTRDADPPRPFHLGALRRPLFQVRFFPELRPLDAVPNGGGRALSQERFARQPQLDRGGAERGAWLLVVAPRAGSLDTAVARLRWRNLGLSAGILGLLGITLALVLIATRREQELARRQLALVAGITHELHTPLAALQAAGQNLEDGLIGDPARVREYGSLVRREGGRLQRLVDQTLALAGMRGDAGALRRERVDLAASIEQAIAESARAAPAATVGVDAGAAVDAGTASGTVLALADREATARILVNLLANARKYGNGRVWVGVRDDVRDGRRDGVTVTVVDDGPGVAPADRSHLFEPFFRGERARDTVAPGSGLGLYLARRLAAAMGGRLELLDAPPAGAPPGLGGAAFRLRLPRAEGPAR
ncbi:MAG TPA: HAMP domain-containing sensor histidine kinase [Thermoanaerobaculia bacterium]|nr:HAMP domain-containing sensor histidine kinase [Thermoanaerobaculia bacterium]